MKIKFWSGKEIGLIIKNPALRKIMTAFENKKSKKKQVEMTAYNSFEDNTLEGLLSKYGCPRRRYFYKETHPEYKAWFAGLPGEIQIKINLLRDTKKIDEKTIKEETNVVRKKIHSFSGRKRKNNFGRDVNFREKTYAFELEKYLFKNSGLNQETGCSKWVKISELPHELNFTGNGSKQKLKNLSNISGKILKIIILKNRPFCPD